MHMHKCRHCDDFCSDTFVVRDIDREYFYCGRTLCGDTFKNHHTAAWYRRMDAGLICNFEIPGSDQCGRESVNIEPEPSRNYGRCRLHVAQPALSAP